MNVGQATALICHGVAAARSQGEVVGHFTTVGGLLRANPGIAREVEDWLTGQCHADLQKPERRAELRTRGVSAAEVARVGARGIIRTMLEELPLVGLYLYVGDHLVDEEMSGYPYPFSFGRCPATLDPDFGTCRGAGR